MSGTNTFTAIIPQLLAQGLKTLRENSIMPRLINHSYDHMAAEHGETITIPIASAVTVKDVSPSSTPATAQTAGFTPTSVSITMDQWKEAPFFITDKEALNIMKGWVPKQADEAIKALANTCDQAILDLYKGVYGYAGTAGTTPFGSSVAEATEARKVLNNQLAPMNDRRMVINADAEANALGLRAFQDMSFSGSPEGINEGVVNRKLGFDWYLDQNVRTLTTGTRALSGSATILTAEAAASTTIIATGDAGLCAIGDQFTIAGDSQVYVCTNATNMNGGTISISPAIQTAASAAAAITFKGALSTAFAQNLAFHRDAFAFVSRPLADNTQGLGNLIESAVDPVSGLALRLEVSRQNKRTMFSYDILYGVEIVRPELACRVWGA